MGNGMTTLARATLIADRYGAGSYGTIGGVAAFFTTGARAGGPVAAAVYAPPSATPRCSGRSPRAVVAAALAFRAETAQPVPDHTVSARRSRSATVRRGCLAS